MCKKKAGNLAVTIYHTFTSQIVANKIIYKRFWKIDSIIGKRQSTPLIQGTGSDIERNKISESLDDD